MIGKVQAAPDEEAGTASNTNKGAIPKRLPSFQEAFRESAMGKPPSDVMWSSTAEGPSSDANTLVSEIKVEPMDLSHIDEPPPIRVRKMNTDRKTPPTTSAGPTTSNGYPIIPTSDIEERVLDIQKSTRPRTPLPMSPEYVPTYSEYDNPGAEIPKNSPPIYFARKSVPKVDATTPRDVHLPEVIFEQITHPLEESSSSTQQDDKK